MAKFSNRIEAFCSARDIDMPPGFFRRAASRYAVVVRAGGGQTAKLVARTWDKVADVLYYLDHHAPDGPHEIYDFKDMRRLERRGARLVTCDTIA